MCSLIHTSAEAKYRVIPLVLCTLECVIFSGLLFGWASLVFVLVEDGVFSYVCGNSTETKTNATTASSSREISVSCASQERLLVLVDTVAMSCFTAFYFPVGYCMDRWGLRPIRTTGSICAVSGCLMIAFANKEWSALLFPGTLLLAIASAIIVITNYHIANLAGKWVFTVTGLYAGASAASTVVYLIIKLAHDNGVGREYTFTILGLLYVIVLINTWVFLPPYKVSLQETITTNVNVKDTEPEIRPMMIETITQNKMETQEGGNQKCLLRPCENGIPIECETKIKNKKCSSKIDDKTVVNSSFKAVLISFKFTLLLYWFSIMHLSVKTYIGMFNPWVSYVVDHNSTLVSLYTDAYGYIMLSGFAFAHTPGFMTDKIRIFLQNKGWKQPAVLSTVLLFFIGSTLSIIQSLAVLIESSERIIWLSMVLFIFVRVFTYAPVVIFLQAGFPKDHFGKTYGVLNISIGIVAMLNYPLSYWNSSGKSFTPSFTLLFILSTSTLIFPVFLLYVSRQHINKKTNMAEYLPDKYIEHDLDNGLV